MITIRAAYLEAAGSAVTLLSDPAVAAAWERPSVLPEFGVHGLTGHLGSQVLHVSRALAAEVPDEKPLSVPEYFAAAAAFHTDLDAESNVRIRHGSEAAASGGVAALVSQVDMALAGQQVALAAEPMSRVVRTATGMSMLLDDYLLTRIMEIAVHSDDLALSAEIPTPLLPPAVFEPVLDLLSRLAVVRHGQVAVLRALSRAERAPDTIAGI
ncbi:maleylpyruvate isomerase N-terminal domain-containing protein [Nocardia sp. BMG111209]|uniref:maleylpyruvate isomerase N-terminal domain-containing protein n=1 Tax=Nocardia sp. BMG111209 TaxID=1160137 RepID=UPI00036BF01A|nr:maleylpyruvate isomerase N-terminal domain-containing protein [Nocardia sp. BMG111209]